MSFLLSRAIGGRLTSPTIYELYFDILKSLIGSLYVTGLRFRGAWPGLKFDRVLIIAIVFESCFSEPYQVLLDYLDFDFRDLRYEMKSPSF